MTLTEWLKKTPERELFHYTTPEGLLGIVSSGKLWATIIHHLDDEKEFGHALEIFSAEIYRATKDSQADISTVPGTIGNALRDALERTANMSIAVASFSENGDLLSQWRGYCRKGGFSLGFAPDTVMSLAAKNEFRLVRCIYDPNLQCEIARDIVTRCLASYRGEIALQNANITEIRTKFCSALMIEFSRCAPIFKDHSFYEEVEWRVIAGAPTNDPRLRVRATPGRLIPYLEFDLLDISGRIQVLNLIVGPAQNSKLALQAAGMFRFVHAKRLNLISVRPSRVPLRISRT